MKISLEDRFPWYQRNPYLPTKPCYYFHPFRMFRRWLQWCFNGNAGEWWYLSDAWVAYVLPRLRDFRRGPRMGLCPGGFDQECFPHAPERGETLTDEQQEEVVRRWGKVLDKIILAFEIRLEDDWILGDDNTSFWERCDSGEYDYGEPPCGMPSWRAAHEAAREGFDLWWKYWEGLWD